MADMADYPPLTERPIKNTICLFDVDGTLSPARRVGTPFSTMRLQAMETNCILDGLS